MSLTAVSSPINTCPFVDDPYKECYCYEMKSRDVRYAINICGGRYDSCYIYLKRQKETLEGERTDSDSLLVSENSRAR